MEANEFGNFQLLHSEIIQQEEEDQVENTDPSSSGGANKEQPALRSGRNDSSISISSEESLIEVAVGNIGFTSNLEDEHSTSTMDVPSIQTMERSDLYDPNRIPQSAFSSREHLSPGEWSTTSEESLFSIHPKTNSYGGDQAFLLAAEMHKEKEEFTESNDKNIGEERQSKVEEEPPQMKEGEAKPPNATVNLYPSPCSDGSESSTYSFTFPVLVPNVIQNSSTEGDAQSSRRRPSKVQQSSNTRQRPLPHKRTISCFCFSCHSCFSCCFCDSCCTRPSWSCFSWFTLPSCKSCSSCCTLPSCKSCSSCCTLPSCKSCPSCCTLQSCKSCPSCCTLPSCQSCLSCCNFPSCYACCTHLSRRSCCGRLSCHSSFTCPSCKKCSCLSCWPCR